LNILLDLPRSAIIEIEIYSMTGQMVYHTLESCNERQNTFLIALDDYPAGLYTLRIYSRGGINLVKKIIKTKRGGHY